MQGLNFKNELEWTGQQQGPKPETWKAKSGVGFLETAAEKFSCILETPDGRSHYLGPVAPISVNCTVSWLTDFTLLLLADVATHVPHQPTAVA